MITLRPHHILCFQGYIGKGYSKSFIDNMNIVVAKLKEDPSINIKLTPYADDVCKKCPHKVKNVGCTSNNKVLSMDKKVMDYLNLDFKIYSYKYLLNRLQHNITIEAFNDICSSCEWCKYGLCHEAILDKVKS
ncbi:DUF1284 domain-containing protein [Clostridium lundense]|uniref:DUF1284 domain-containing protein n=1 Tax=Clostridium lundense TaxID=319475 RepID=UPI000489EAE4|nr:DUF1284 domain-containing protein [Clostridium lundense]